MVNGCGINILLFKLDFDEMDCTNSAYHFIYFSFFSLKKLFFLLLTGQRHSIFEISEGINEL